MILITLGNIQLVYILRGIIVDVNEYTQYFYFSGKPFTFSSKFIELFYYSILFINCQVFFKKYAIYRLKLGLYGITSISQL